MSLQANTWASKLDSLENIRKVKSIVESNSKDDQL